MKAFPLGLALGALPMILSGCAELDAMAVPPPPPRAEAEVPEVEISEMSTELAAYYRRVEAGLRTRGLLRADGGGPDVPYDDRRLAETFRAAAFAREFTDVGGALVRQEGESLLNRWQAPAKLELIFGPSVPDSQRADDSAAIGRYAERLAQVTRHPVSVVPRGGNFQVLILSEDERRVSGPLLRRLIPGIRPHEIDVVQDLDRATYCIIFTSDPKDDGILTRAVAVIRAELPPLLRLSCIHEEIAQGLGLTNDSPRARPSIFNDDDEFGRLTAMDEKMLQMLYDPRLTPGMDAATADPIVRQMAAELTGGTS